jgi:hypothetical protein
MAVLRQQCSIGLSGDNQYQGTLRQAAKVRKWVPINHANRSQLLVLPVASSLGVARESTRLKLNIQSNVKPPKLREISMRKKVFLATSLLLTTSLSLIAIAQQGTGRPHRKRRL